MELRHQRPEHLQVIANLRHRADGRARGADGVALLDGDGWRDALNAVNGGLVHAVEELPRIGREGFDVATLAFGVERVERQRTLARAAQAGDDDQPVQRQVEIEALEVVVTNTSEANDG